MRILNEQDIEITKEEADKSLGRLISDKFLKYHHEAVEEVKEVSHTEPTEFFFTDGTSYVVEDAKNDPHVDGMYYINLEGEPEKQVYGTSAITVIDVEGREAQEAWDEYEEIIRYVLFTQEELDARAKQLEDLERREQFIVTGPERLTSVEVNTEDLILLMAELIGA